MCIQFYRDRRYISDVYLDMFRNPAQPDLKSEYGAKYNLPMFIRYVFRKITYVPIMFVQLEGFDIHRYMGTHIYCHANNFRKKYNVSIVRRQTSTREIPLFPFLSMMLQSLVWLIYGVLKGSIAVALPNLVGFLLGTCYTYVHDLYAIDKDRNAWGYALSLVFLVTLGALVLYLPNSEQTVHILGVIGAVSSVCFMASPLVAILRVGIQRESAGLFHVFEDLMLTRVWF